MTDRSKPPAEEPQGFRSEPGFVKSRYENNQHYVDQFAGHPWEPAIREVAEDIQELCPRINISQIKSKFGGLRFYYDIPDDLRPEEMASWLKGDVAQLRAAVDRAVAWATGWCEGRDHATNDAKKTDLAVDPEFERGAKAAAESMRFYFLDENEGSIYPDLSTEVLEQHEQFAVTDVLRDEQQRIERLGEGRPLVVPSAYRVLPTGYDSAELVDKDGFEVDVQWRGRDPETSIERWAVTHMGRCLSSEGRWEHEPLPSSRDEEFLRRFRFSLDEALRRATEAVDQVTINGRTLAQWEARHRA